MALHIKFGEEGENAAVDFLFNKSYQILEVNYRLHPYEVDIIDRKSTRLNSSHIQKSRMPSSA